MEVDVMNRPLRIQIRSFLLVAALTGLAAPAALAAGTFVEDVTAPYGVLNGIEYVRHTGRFEGVSNFGPYRVPYDIIAPADPAHASGRVIVEPAHQSFPLAARHSFLGNAFLASRGYAHALIGWSTLAESILVPGARDVFLSAPTVGGVQNDTGIIADFAHALRQDPTAAQLLGELDWVYGYGYSRTATFTFRLLNSPEGRDLFAFTLLQSPSFPATFRAPYSPPEGIGNVITVTVEADLINSPSTAAFRVDDERYPHYRQYEVAGAPHIPNNAATRRVQPALANTTPLDQSPIIRALLDAGDAWVQDAVEPPPSRTITVAPAGQVDPLYPARGFTGVARDENLNALGGIRLPDLELGRGRYVAVDFAINPVFGVAVVLFGTWQDLRCVAKPDGSERFRNHGAYVRGFIHAATDLVRDRFLLMADASDLVSEASKSEVGKPHDCH
jgi:alpha/beta hydrolase family protein